MKHCDVRTLKQFGVISAPDDTFSCVEMTDLGKEYYSQGRKFKQGEQRGFTMYFDLTAGGHNKAKTLFHKISETFSNWVNPYLFFTVFNFDFERFPTSS